MTDPDRAQLVRRHVEGVIGVPATEGNRITPLRNGDEIFPAMFDAIAAAEHTIDLLTFVYWQGEVGTRLAEALSKQARAGVRVRLLLDSFGARTLDPAAIALMSDNDVDLRWFRPLKRYRPQDANHRTHRKVMIVDEATAFTGGVGIADVWQGNARNENEWRDTHFRIEGPVVDGLRGAFLDNWIETDSVLFTAGIDRFPDQPQHGDAVAMCVRGSSERGWSDIATMFRTLLQLAEHRVRLTTAYFVPDDDLNASLCAATERGVRVEILIPGPHADKRFVQIAAEADYDRLLRSGVRIWNYQPTMLHAKVMTVDGFVASVGSANLNSRSMSLDEETNVIALDSQLVAELDRHFDEDLERSVEIEAGRWNQRAWHERLYERLTSPLRRFF